MQDFQSTPSLYCYSSIMMFFMYIYIAVVQLELSTSSLFNPCVPSVHYNKEQQGDKTEYSSV